MVEMSSRFQMFFIARKDLRKDMVNLILTVNYTNSWVKIYLNR